MGGLVEELEPYFDFSIVEQCYRYNECCKYDAFVKNGKPVFAIEYNGGKRVNKNMCQKFESKDFSLIFGNFKVSKLAFCDNQRRVVGVEDNRERLGNGNYLEHRERILFEDNNKPLSQVIRSDLEKREPRLLRSWGSC